MADSYSVYAKGLRVNVTIFKIFKSIFLKLLSLTKLLNRLLKETSFCFLQEKVTNTWSHFGFPKLYFYQESLSFLS